MGALSALGQMITNYFSPQMPSSTAVDYHSTPDYLEKMEDRAYNEQQVQLEREWEERMANTAIQRQMADMKAAGINPLLAANYGGASVPSVTPAQSPTVQTSAAVASRKQKSLDMYWRHQDRQFAIIANLIGGMIKAAS